MNNFENKPKISIVKASSYDDEKVFFAVKKCIDLLGGINHFVKSGQKVLIKPNLLAAKTPDKAVTTHPGLVKAVIELVQSVKGIPVIGDGPAIGKWEQIIEKTGMAKIAEQTGVQIVPFTKNIRIPSTENTIFKHLEITDTINEVDAIINLPKLKTHSQMFLTLSVKNLYGLIAGKKKAKLHMEAGSDHLCFANMLVEIYNYAKPVLSIMDGIVGMEGNGPGSGDPKKSGLIIGGIDGIALDRVVCEIIGADKDRLYTTIVGEKTKSGQTDLSCIEVVGESISDVKITDFKFPVTGDVEFGPKFLRKWVKKLITSKPVVDKKKCTLCGYCIKSCPPEIILQTGKNLKIDYEKCIRCYCCVEVCPHGAMKVKQGWLVDLLGLK